LLQFVRFSLELRSNKPKIRIGKSRSGFKINLIYSRLKSEFGDRGD